MPSVAPHSSFLRTSSSPFCLYLLILFCRLLVLISSHFMLFFLGTLLYIHNFNYHLYSHHFKIYIYSPHISYECLCSIFNCLFDISTWMLQVPQSQYVRNRTHDLSHSQTLFSFRIPHFRNHPSCHANHKYICHVGNLLFLHSYIQSILVSSHKYLPTPTHFSLPPPHCFQFTLCLIQVIIQTTNLVTFS